MRAGCQVRYDAAIIGAGADGLAAAVLLARAGLETVVIERGAEVGGRCITRSFAPGFSASPFADDLPRMPPALVQALGLAQQGVILKDAPADGRILFRRDAIISRVRREAQTPVAQTVWEKLHAHMTPEAEDTSAWPGADWADKSIAEVCIGSDKGAGAVLAGRAIDPHLSGSALALLVAARTQVETGGLGALGQALAAAARQAGAQIRLGTEPSEVRLHHRRVQSVQLADGEEIETGVVLSTLDFKRTILSLFAWDAVPPPLLAAARDWRATGARARLLIALRTLPPLEAPLYLPGDGEALAAFRRGAVPEKPPLYADPVSRRDPSLAPPGGGVITVTLGAIPHTLFDGAWTGDKRAALAARALARLEAQAPGIVANLAGLKIFVPPDIEEALGASGGDLDGGVLAPDQMLGLRPGPRSAISGLYLAGSSCRAAPHGACVGGAAAAAAIIADRSGAHS
jgi:phytoene dehydrogenase-like protein